MNSLCILLASLGDGENAKHTEEMLKLLQSPIVRKAVDDREEEYLVAGAIVFMCRPKTSIIAVESEVSFGCVFL